MTLVTTPGAADAVSYASVAEADAYHLTHLYATDWDAASETQKEAALVMATRVLDASPRAWLGAASVETQALGWPRTGLVNRNGFAIASGELPSALKQATAEFARQLLTADRTADNAIVLQGIASLSAGPVSLSFRDREPEYLAITRKESLEAVVPDAVIALLVPSWLKDPRDEDDEYSGLIFERLQVDE
jgi:hypothetical protein